MPRAKKALPVPSFGISVAAGFAMTESAEASLSLSMIDQQICRQRTTSCDVEVRFVRWFGELEERAERIGKAFKKQARLLGLEDTIGKQVMFWS
jgi:hypothetical protein